MRYLVANANENGRFQLLAAGLKLTDTLLRFQDHLRGKINGPLLGTWVVGDLGLTFSDSYDIIKTFFEPLFQPR